VTASLKSLLENGLIDHQISTMLGSDVVVSVGAPDRISIGADERPQLNLFLYHAAPNTSLRSLPAGEAASTRKTGENQPLALDLHYLLTAYGAKDLEAEILLGYSLQLFRGSPTIKREKLEAMLHSLTANGNGSSASTPGSRLSPETQVREVTLRPLFQSAEEMSRLWSALQARYRPSVTYKASMVVI